MSREAFYSLLERYLEGKCTAEEKKVVEQWYAMLDDEDLQQIHKSELSALADKTWDNINAKIQLSSTPIQRKPIRTVGYWLPRLSVAASVIGLLLVISYLIPVPQSQPDFLKGEKESLVKKVNNTSQPIDLLLDDGSKVVLQAQSELTFPKQFADGDREVFVKGEAFFHVEKDEDHPFYVYSQDLITQVVGTTFIVKSNEKTKQSEVVVLTGKVRVTKNETHENFYQKIRPSKSAMVTLTPNQKVVYEKEEELTITLVEDPTPIMPEDQHKNNFLFNESPLSVVIAEIEKVYGIEITSTNEKIYQCTFTGDLTDQNLYDMLDFVVHSVGATYKIESAKIRIEGGNCN